MSSGEQEALQVADALDFVFRDGSIEAVQSAQRVIRRLVAEREADRAAMREAIAAGQRWIYAMDKWLATGVPAHPAESKSIYEQQGAAISLLKERIE